MNCTNCNTPLINTYVCPRCGQKDELARKIIYASNWHYNQGLAKAKVRDMTGATNSLLMSLKYNKRNTQARNLLGLIYYQIGEIVNALGEWVISVHFQPEDNVANTYIKSIQNNPGKLQAANRIIQKYNMALEFLEQGNMDMAIIELKKAINLNPNYIRAYQLMGLLYFKTKQYAAARKVLVRSLKIDRNNITSLRYIKEIDAVAGDRARARTRHKDGFTQINDPNPVVVEEKKDGKYTDFSTGLLSIVNVIIGVVIGAAVVWLLLVPSVRRNLALEYNQAVVEYGNLISENNRLISSYKMENESLSSENESLQAQVDAASDSQEAGTSEENLYLAIQAYISGSDAYGEAGVYLADVDPDSLSSESAQEIYRTIYEATRSAAESQLESDGYQAFNNGEYMDAIDYYQKALNLNSENLDALYYIGASYQRMADLDNAMTYYNRLINDYPTSTQAANAAEAVQEIQDNAGQDGTDGSSQGSSTDGSGSSDGSSSTGQSSSDESESEN